MSIVAKLEVCREKTINHNTHNQKKHLNTVFLKPQFHIRLRYAPDPSASELINTLLNSIESKSMPWNTPQTTFQFTTALWTYYPFRVLRPSEAALTALRHRRCLIGEKCAERKYCLCTATATSAGSSAAARSRRSRAPVWPAQCRSASARPRVGRRRPVAAAARSRSRNGWKLLSIGGRRTAARAWICRTRALCGRMCPPRKGGHCPPADERLCSFVKWTDARILNDRMRFQRSYGNLRFCVMWRFGLYQSERLKRQCEDSNGLYCCWMGTLGLFWLWVFFGHCEKS